MAIARSLLRLLATLVLLKICRSEIEIAIDEHWELFKSHYNKSYDEEDAKRMAIFDENVALISKHNLENDVRMNTYMLAINNFTDLSTDEFNAMFHRYEMEIDDHKCSGSKDNYTSDFLPMPDSVDYRNIKMVTSVKNQYPCSNGYAHAAAGALEALWKKKSGELFSLSTHEISECSIPEGSKGCEGGSVNRAFDYILKNKGVDRVIPYPFKEKPDLCADTNKNYRASLKEYRYVPSGNEEALKAIVAFHGPVTAAVDAHLPEFHFYRSGVFYSEKCTRKPNHALLVVGYGTEDGLDYWLLKNSYGKTWGDNGYMKMARNRNNLCNIASLAVYPV